MKKINAISKFTFDTNFNNEIIKKYTNKVCFISILDCDNHELKYDCTLENFLQVKMWDIESDIIQNNIIKYKKPEDSELLKIINFINLHNSKSHFIVHCSAGISRSGAVVRYISEKFNDIDIDYFKKENKQIQPNLFILNRLRNLDKFDIKIL
jgi:predicted protein tyrosine phosphatase